MAVRRFAPKGGQEKFALRLAAFLAARGHAVRVYAFAGEPMPGVDLRLLPRPLAPRMWRDWITGARLAAALRADDADLTWGEQKVWDAHVVRPGGGCEHAYWQAHARRPALHPKRWFDLDAERRAYSSPRLRRVLANSARVRGHLLARHPALAGRIEVVHNGWDAADVPPVAADAGPHPPGVTALFAGHDFARKGLAHAVAAVAEAARVRPDLPLRLVIAGSGRPGPYAALAARLGVPVVTTRANGGSEIIRDGVDGWVLDRPEDSARMAAILVELADPAAKARFRAAARAAADHHRLEDKLRAIELILLSAAGEIPSPRGGNP